MLNCLSWGYRADKYFFKWRGRTKIADVMDLLVEKGFPTDQIRFPDDFNRITQLVDKGAKLRHFADAYELVTGTMNCQQCNFDIYYFLKIVDKLVSKYS